MKSQISPNAYDIYIDTGFGGHGRRRRGGRGVTTSALLKTAGFDPQKFSYFSNFFLETFNFL